MLLSVRKSPPPYSIFFFFCSRSSVRALTRAKTFVTQAKKNQFDNREQDLLAQSVVFGDFKRLDTIQVEPCFLILSQEEKKSLCSRGAGSHRYRETRFHTVANSMKKASL